MLQLPNTIRSFGEESERVKELREQFRQTDIRDAAAAAKAEPSKAEQMRKKFRKEKERTGRETPLTRDILEKRLGKGVISVNKVEDGGVGFIVQLKNGKSLLIRDVADIGEPDAVGVYYPYELSVGDSKMTVKGVIEMAGGVSKGVTLGHELFHAAMDMALTQAFSMSQ